MSEAAQQLQLQAWHVIFAECTPPDGGDFRALSKCTIVSSHLCGGDSDAIVPGQVGENRMANELRQRDRVPTHDKCLDQAERSTQTEL